MGEKKSRRCNHGIGPLFREMVNGVIVVRAMLASNGKKIMKG
jgi:hypothetical protein